MFPSLMCDLVGIRANPAQAIELAATHGFGGVDLLSEELLHLSDADISALNERFAQTGLKRGYISLIPNRIPVPDDDWNNAARNWRRVAEVARQLGYTRTALVLLPFHETLEREEALEQHVQRLQQLAPVLDDSGLRLGLEYVAASTRRAPYSTHTVWNLAGTLELLDRVGYDNVGLMLDTFHWHCAGEGVEELEDLRNEQIVVVHVNDAPNLPLDQHTVMNRALPGKTGVIDSAGFFGALMRIGYNGPLTCESGPSAIKALGPSNEEVLESVKSAFNETLLSIVPN
jgi:sugar phosphate isomerase/epimerase